MKVWMVYKEVINWGVGVLPGEMDNCWWLYEKKQDAMHRFFVELGAYHEEYDQRNDIQYDEKEDRGTYIRLEMYDVHRFTCFFREEEILDKFDGFLLQD